MKLAGLRGSIFHYGQNDMLGNDLRLSPPLSWIMPYSTTTLGLTGYLTLNLIPVETPSSMTLV